MNPTYFYRAFLGCSRRKIDFKLLSQVSADERMENQTWISRVGRYVMRHGT